VAKVIFFYWDHIFDLEILMYIFNLLCYCRVFNKVSELETIHWPQTMVTG